METKEFYIKKVNEFVNLYFPNVWGVMLSGSFTTKYFNETSDLDILIFSNLYPRDVFIETYGYENLKMQVLMFPIYNMDRILYSEIAAGNGAYIHMFRKGIILSDRNSFLKKLKQRSGDLYLEGPRHLRKTEYDNLRYKVTSRLEDLKGCDDFSDNFFTAMNVYPLLLSFYFRHKKDWNYEGKTASRELLEKNPDFRQAYIDTFRCFVEGEDKSALINFINDRLDEMGGELHFSYNGHSFETENKDNIVIYISDDENEKQRAKLYILSHKLYRYITKQIPELKVISYVQASK